MAATPDPRQATVPVLLIVAVISGAILLLGDRFDATPGFALSHSARIGAHIAACVADESVRLISSDQEQCRPGELALAPEGAFCVPPR